jgi:LCP family protein required for cell wall assembly
MSKGKKIALWSVLSVLFVLAVGAGALLHTYGGMIKSGHGLKGIRDTISGAGEAAFTPKEGFPGEDKLTIVCMGIDDSWTNSDVVYTSQSRTDTLFVMTLDLINKKATMLSIPRDTYAHIAGTHTTTKINSAYSTGGPERTVATVNEFLGTSANHYLVLNIDATKKMVDALGGVDVNVEHPMHYHDKWGHLSIDLQPGEQHLDGQNAVGFARYRHPDAGKRPTPEDGDERRMYRQHVLMRAMVDKAKTFANVTQAPQLVDVAMSTIRTDFTRQQLFDIAAIFKGVQQSDIQTASLPGTDFRGPGGAWDYAIKPEVAHAYANWLVKGDETASRSLVPVVIKNGTSVPGLAQFAVDQLKAQGYTDVRNGGNAAPAARIHLASSTAAAKPEAARTVMLDTGVANPDAPQDVSVLLGVESPVTSRRPVKPNKLGWTPDPVLTITLGADYAAAAKATGRLNRDLASSGTGGAASAN